MPLRNISDLTTDIARLTYPSDAVFYDFTCQWLAPTLIEGDTVGHVDTPFMNLAFGGDMEGAINGGDTLPLTLSSNSTFGMSTVDNYQT